MQEWMQKLRQSLYYGRPWIVCVALRKSCVILQGSQRFDILNKIFFFNYLLCYVIFISICHGCCLFRGLLV
ncbi:hypothetical protein H5410_012239 [Solanum commersonii]|uniref:Uncharacterized protein n=1 Tax=Solanum commersonii TaxID=4109 RepID=A0A9J6AQY8_SOLCO|nr:hypothetical protein H5410_012239 [Solanum commersonii]